jgi:hypothetical protein
MRGPICSFWANLTPFSLKGKATFYVSLFAFTNGIRLS